jgi:RNA polymerase sigma-70 factor (ECF subfamily)
MPSLAGSETAAPLIHWAPPSPTQGVLVTDQMDFAEFYTATFGPLTVQLRAFTGELAEAQDLAQEAFCRAYPRWERISTYDDPVAWVRKVAWNLAISRWRQLRRFLHSPDLPEAAAGASEPNGNHIDLARALQTLPVKVRAAVVLFYLEDRPITEIAELTGAGENTVKSWLHRGRAALATHLGGPSTKEGPS